MSTSEGARLPVIAVDAMGGDNAPEAIVAGSLLAHRDGLGKIVLVGDRARIEPLLHGESGIEIVHSAGEVAMDAHASGAVRRSQGTSLGDAVDLVRDGRADAVVSAGDGGAFLAIALVRLRTIPGIARPAIGAVLPGREGPVVLCDAGANVDCKPEWLMQFGVMGSAYARAALGVAEPRVAVVSVGEERTKDDGEQVLEAAALLERAPVRFVGNIEGKDIFNNAADVVVADGFVGNVILKTAEGSGMYFRDVLRSWYESAGPLGKLGALLQPRRLRRDASPAELLDVRRRAAAGRARQLRRRTRPLRGTAIRNAIRQAAAVAGADAGRLDRSRARRMEHHERRRRDRGRRSRSSPTPPPIWTRRTRARRFIDVVPLFVNFGDVRYKDNVELTRDEFYRKLATEKALPTTAQPTPAMFEDAFRPHAEAGASGRVPDDHGQPFGHAQRGEHGRASVPGGGDTHRRQRDHRRRPGAVHGAARKRRRARGW